MPNVTDVRFHNHQAVPMGYSRVVDCRERVMSQEISDVRSRFSRRPQWYRPSQHAELLRDLIAMAVTEVGCELSRDGQPLRIIGIEAVQIDLEYRRHFSHFVVGEVTLKNGDQT